VEFTVSSINVCVMTNLFNTYRKVTDVYCENSMKQTNKQTVSAGMRFLVLHKIMYRLSVRCKRCCSLISRSIIFKLNSVTFT